MRTSTASYPNDEGGNGLLKCWLVHLTIEGS